MSACTCPPPDRDLCARCAGWGYEPGTTGDERPLCSVCGGRGGVIPPDLDCPAWELHPAR